VKWFEFDTDFFENKFVRHTYNELGDFGVLSYIKLIALIYKDYDIKHPGKLVISCTTLAQHFNCYEKKLFLLLDFFLKERKLEYEIRGNKIWLYVPKTLERADEYTKKIMRQKSGQKNKNTRTYIRTLSGIQYNTIQDKEVNIEDMETTKKKPLSNLVYRSLKKLLFRKGNN